MASATDIVKPRLVLTDKLTPWYWRYDLVAWTRVVGHLDVSLSGKLIRYEVRARTRSEVKVLPKNITELRDAQILRLAKQTGSGRAVTSVPVLVADRAQTRLAWRVSVLDGHGRPESVNVTPNFAWLDSDEKGSQEASPGQLSGCLLHPIDTFPSCLYIGSEGLRCAKPQVENRQDTVPIDATP
jgi:hypothetical protein